MVKITKRQVQILKFIRNFIEENDYSPTFRDIAEHFKITVNGAQYHVIALEKKGCITYQKGKSRTITIKRI